MIKREWLFTLLDVSYLFRIQPPSQNTLQLNTHLRVRAEVAEWEGRDTDNRSQLPHSICIIPVIAINQTSPTASLIKNTWAFPWQRKYCKGNVNSNIMIGLSSSWHQMQTANTTVLLQSHSTPLPLLLSHEVTCSSKHFVPGRRLLKL